MLSIKVTEQCIFHGCSECLVLINGENSWEQNVTMYVLWKDGSYSVNTHWLLIC